MKKRSLSIFLVLGFLLISYGVNALSGTNSTVTTGGHNKKILSAELLPTYSQKPSVIPTQPIQNSVALVPSPTISNNLVVVQRVVDGDTIQLETGEKLRYIGINTPETVDPRRSVQCFGKEASNKNKELVLGQKVRLEKDVSNTDKYGRLLRYVYLQTPTGEVFVNDYLVRQGYAYASSYPPDIAHQKDFRQAQEEAQENNRGLWSSCGK